MNERIKHWWIIRNGWWLFTAVAAIAACGRLTTAAIAGTKVSSGEFIVWLVIALLWMVTQFLTERQSRQWQRRAERFERFSS